MACEYLGVLQTGDPVHGFLYQEVLGRRLGVAYDRCLFDVFRLDAEVSNWSVFHYVDRCTSVDLVGKFYGNKWLYNGHDGDLGYRAMLMRREFDNLQRVRAMGFDTGRHQVVEPLATNEATNCLLVEAFVSGFDLRLAISKACRQGNGEMLRDQLTEVARFLASLHSQSQTDEPLNEKTPLSRLDRICEQLLSQQIISTDQCQRFRSLRDHWAQRQLLCRGRQVLIHGDATPAHFIFGREREMTVIDFESLAAGDPATDLGQMAAELKRLFFWYCCDSWGGETYIQHLYASYARFVQADANEFSALTARGRFHMACVQAGMGCNCRLSPEYRRRLITDAEEILAI